MPDQENTPRQAAHFRESAEDAQTGIPADPVAGTDAQGDTDAVAGFDPMADAATPIPAEPQDVQPQEVPLREALPQEPAEEPFSIDLREPAGRRFRQESVDPEAAATPRTSTPAFAQAMQERRGLSADERPLGGQPSSLQQAPLPLPSQLPQDETPKSRDDSDATAGKRLRAPHPREDASRQMRVPAKRTTPRFKRSDDQAADAAGEKSLSSGAVAHRTALSNVGQGTPYGEQGKKRGVGTIIAIVVALIIAAVAIFFLVRFVRTKFFQPEEVIEAPVVEPGLTVTVTIPDGSDGYAIADILVEAGIISDRSAFLQALERRGDSAKLKSGVYDLVTGSSVETVIDQLVEGPNSVQGKLTVPEGLPLSRIATTVESALGIPAEEFLAQAKASNYVADYPFLEAAVDDSLEGFLFPKTYSFAGMDVTADLVIRTMLDQYVAEMANFDFAASEQAIQDRYGVTMTDYDILIMASIIEREASTDDDRPLVSSVFYNRLNDGMMLQSDATMWYVTGGEVTASDLREESPYNTYLHEGLTPTPICSPSVESIQAALNPADTNYYYFLLIDRDGYSNHTFSETYDEHLAAIEQANQDLA